MAGVRTTLRLALACAAVAAAIRLVERGEFRLSPQGDRPSRLVPRRLDEIDRITLTDSNGHARVFRLAPDGWRIEAPFSAPASGAAIMQLVDAIEAAPLKEFIDDQEISLRDLSYSDFGLGAATKGTIEAAGPRTSLRIHLGDMTVETNEAFVSVDGTGGVSVTDPVVIRCFERPIEDFTDRRLCRANLRETETVIVERPGETPLRLKRRGDRRGWEIQSPEQRHADWGQMAKFFEALSTARIASVVSGTEQGGDAPDFGVGVAPREPSFTVKLYGRNSPTPSAVSVFGPVQGDGGLFLALNDSGLEVTVSEETAKAISIRAGDVRDRRVFASGHTLDVTSVSILGPDGEVVSAGRPSGRDWEIVAPSRAKADQEKVSQLLGEMLSLEADAYIPASGLSEGAADGSPVAAEGPVFALGTHSATNRIVCHFLPSADGTTNAAVVVDASEFAAVVPTGEISTLLSAAVQPQLLLSRNVAAISPKELLTVTIAKGQDAPVTVEFAPDGTWAAPNFAADAETAPGPDNPAFADIVARQVVALLPGQRAGEFQLDNPRLRATFAFRDTSVPQLVLEFGALAGDGAGVYATVNGCGAVYDLPAGIFYALDRIASAKR